VDEPLDDDVVEAHLPADQPHARWFLRRFADAIGDYYRTMDPHVAQLITAPGVLPATPSEPSEPETP
jgi:hypothetical protein